MSNNNPSDMHAIMERFFALADKVKEARGAGGRSSPGPTLTEIVTAMRDLEATITSKVVPADKSGESPSPHDLTGLCGIGPQGLAKLANAPQDPVELKAFYVDLAGLVEAIPLDDLGLGGSDTATRSWRLLPVDRAIAATRSLDPALMEEAFASALRYLPADAERLFEEDMRQMDVSVNPVPVREVMRRYSQRAQAPKTYH